MRAAARTPLVLPQSAIVCVMDDEDSALAHSERVRPRGLHSAIGAARTLVRRASGKNAPRSPARSPPPVRSPPSPIAIVSASSPSAATFELPLAVIANDDGISVDAPSPSTGKDADDGLPAEEIKRGEARQLFAGRLKFLVLMIEQDAERGWLEPISPQLRDTLAAQHRLLADSSGGAARAGKPWLAPPMLPPHSPQRSGGGAISSAGSASLSRARAARVNLASHDIIPGEASPKDAATSWLTRTVSESERDDDAEGFQPPPPREFKMKSYRMGDELHIEI